MAVPHNKGSKSNKSSNDKPKGNKSDGKKKQYSATTRDVEDQRRQEYAKRRRDLKGAAVNLPGWVIEGVERVTPKDRIAPTLEALGAASEALADGKYQSAVRHANRAKTLSPQDPTIRETLGIAAYRLGDWKTALTELRAYRRIAGETTHLPIEMDVLRAQGRSADVESAWKELNKRGGHGLVMNEGKVVYASFLLDEGRAAEAWKIVNPGRLEKDPNEAHLRLYYVAARTAAAMGDRSTARQLSDAIVVADPSFPGYEDLETEIAAIG
jgi:tetratricopeptide (TPR) repeat protein